MNVAVGIDPSLSGFGFGVVGASTVALAEWKAERRKESKAAKVARYASQGRKKKVPTRPAEPVEERIGRCRGLARRSRGKILRLRKQGIITRVAVIEGYAHGRSPGKGKDGGGSAQYSAAIMCELGGSVRSELIGIGVELLEISPGTLKKFQCGNGGAKKPEAVAILQRRFRPFRTHNRADAFGLARLGAVYAGIVRATTDYEAEVVETLRRRLEAGRNG